MSRLVRALRRLSSRSLRHRRKDHQTRRSYRLLLRLQGQVHLRHLPCLQLRDPRRQIP